MTVAATAAMAVVVTVAAIAIVFAVETGAAGLFQTAVRCRQR